MPDQDREPRPRIPTREELVLRGILEGDRSPEVIGAMRNSLTLAERIEITSFRTPDVYRMMALTAKAIAGVPEQVLTEIAEGRNTSFVRSNPGDIVEMPEVIEMGQRWRGYTTIADELQRRLDGKEGVIFGQHAPGTVSGVFSTMKKRT